MNQFNHNEYRMPRMSVTIIECKQDEDPQCVPSMGPAGLQGPCHKDLSAFFFGGGGGGLKITRKLDLHKFVF